MEPEIPAIPTPPPQVVPPTISPVFPKKNNLVVILLSIFLLITLLISGYLFLQVQSLTKQLAQIQVQPTPTPLSTETPSPTPDTTANWQTYSNQEIGFSIKYPQEWREQKWTGGVGFGPKEVEEDVLFGINYYSKSTTNINAIASKIGSQFTDRKETITANKIIVTTPSQPDWYSETILFENPNWYIAVSNGAIKNENLPFDRGVPAGFTFEKFYSTFKFTN